MRLPISVLPSRFQTKIMNRYNSQFFQTRYTSHLSYICLITAITLIEQVQIMELHIVQPFSTLLITTES
jgi:hypothetical protein